MWVIGKLPTQKQLADVFFLLSKQADRTLQFVSTQDASFKMRELRAKQGYPNFSIPDNAHIHLSILAHDVPKGQDRRYPDFSIHFVSIGLKFSPPYILHLIIAEKHLSASLDEFVFNCSAIVAKKLRVTYGYGLICAFRDDEIEYSQGSTGVSESENPMFEKLAKEVRKLENGTCFRKMASGEILRSVYRWNITNEKLKNISESSGEVTVRQLNNDLFFWFLPKEKKEIVFDKFRELGKTVYTEWVDYEDYVPCRHFLVDVDDWNAINEL